MRTVVKNWIVVLAVVCGGCGMSPVAPTTPPPTPTYVVIGDSIGLGGQWATVETTLGPHTWINAAVGSTYIHTSWQPDGSAYRAMRLQVANARPKAFLAHLGANDTILQPPPTADGVFADLHRLAGAIATDYPGAVLYLSDVGQVWTYGDKRAENAEVRAGIERAWRELPNVRQGPMLRDLTPDDGVHFTSDSNVNRLAVRWIAALK